MNQQIKPDAHLFINYIDQLIKEPWLGQSRRWWPKFVYHFTNIDNAVKILEDGRLLSRGKLNKLQGMVTDNASPNVIENTDDRWKEFVRLYFRPRTPTQFQNEGIRPKENRYHGAHCPVPIFFLFDSKKILIRKSVQFSKQSLAIAGTIAYSDFIHFREIPFRQVYHDDWFLPEDRDLIVPYRHAEVIVPDELDLEDLRYIWCRSEAEQRTLMNLLTKETREKWKSKIGSGKKGNFFFRNWLFVEKVHLSEESITFYFNLPVNHEDEPYELELTINENITGNKYFWNGLLQGENQLTFELSNLLVRTNYSVKLYCDNQIIFADEFIYDDDLPF
ncbi:DarT ssDNA thymidine ADP-ribosyltransferase family protein [Caldifermentibacillus hisashii]|uniref:DarT ssDNA thymidine ADP-ribosyltransferase family protein n=1 Tax=Caldifermentibacillus hisashii TaxID=996558 RepID=UPI001C11C499|nr:DarT ssDNA thymidine ADP-ribosyltransferase family protein [Caldifermentibacillus hisashii]MBU5343669.1 DUF4433 domain-containing protein [Caldifermentibacillus hisashii]